mgnify:CR=1 FL=1
MCSVIFVLFFFYVYFLEMLLLENEDVFSLEYKLG